ncbi:hypothetical protein [Ruminococcus flavefaciens]|uniref:hypothetical protein n=1 Tax=Ruminococcus flavefaciens TaxID=1265 RepID=UPI0026EE6140|nr:hypothetical protein [Ruminococcus flavefaciens]MDD7515363.1 hypothetical protein [Ruminococcus flavefaciens]MDY5691806.1 hypothetical protein [Ruminococcus flavefaciens]
MSIWWYFATVILSVGVLFMLLNCINLLRGMLKFKEKAVVMNLAALLLYLIAIVAGCALAAFNSGFRVPWILMTVILLLSIVCLAVPVTPQGIVSAGPLGCKLLPREEYSYEYANDKMGECLLIFRQGAEKPAKFHLGIKNTSAVKILADWYGKHGYENPLTK